MMPATAKTIVHESDLTLTYHQADPKNVNLTIMLTLMTPATVIHEDGTKEKASLCARAPVKFFPGIKKLVQKRGKISDWAEIILQTNPDLLEKLVLTMDSQITKINSIKRLYGKRIEKVELSSRSEIWGNAPTVKWSKPAPRRTNKDTGGQQEPGKAPGDSKEKGAGGDTVDNLPGVRKPDEIQTGKSEEPKN